MIVIISIINFFIWSMASIIIALAAESLLFGSLYFAVGYPLSLFMLRYSEYFTISELDKLSQPSFSIWLKKLTWSNGTATAIIWLGLFLIYLVLTLLAA